MSHRAGQVPATIDRRSSSSSALTKRRSADRSLAASKRKSTYRPLTSIWEGEDAELLERMLGFYPRSRVRTILDATVNGARFWRGSKRRVVGIDIERRHRPTLVSDNTQMPFQSDAFDVVVYDPPHIPNQGRDRSKDFNTRFGLVLRSPKEHGYNFAHTYPPFLREANRVLRSEGILLCKITDYIHDHRYQLGARRSDPGSPRGRLLSL